MTELMLKTDAITEQYLERFGRVRIGIYRLIVSPYEPFSSFLGSLMIVLRRKDLMPCYAWFTTAAPEIRYLIIWCNGYFSEDLEDVAQTVFRLGHLHSLRDLQMTGWATGDISDVTSINTRLNELISTNYFAWKQLHHRSFGTSAPL